MKTFNELFEEAKESSDRRTKAFTNLKNKFSDEILPEFVKALKMCDYSVTYFHTGIKIFSEEMTEYVDYESEGYPPCFCFGITEKGEIKNVSYEYDGYNYKYDYNDDDDLKEIRNVGILELVRLIKARVEKYTAKLQKDYEKAESYIEA